jgi:hypothetical protein
LYEAVHVDALETGHRKVVPGRIELHQTITIVVDCSDLAESAFEAAGCDECHASLREEERPTTGITFAACITIQMTVLLLLVVVVVVVVLLLLLVVGMAAQVIIQ